MIAKKFRLRISPLVLMMLSLITGCELKSPTVPKWDTSLLLPLTDATYSLSSFTKQAGAQSVIIENGIASYVFESSYKTFDIGDTLQVRDTNVVSTSSAEDYLKIPAFNSSASQSLGNIATASGITLPGGTSLLPEFTGIRSPAFVFPALTDIESVTVATGGIEISVANNTGVTFTDISIVLTDDAGGTATSISTVTLPLVGAGTTVTAILPLAGKTFSSALTAAITDGKILSQTATVNTANLISFSISPAADLKFSRARARFGAQLIERTGTLSISGDVIERLRQFKLKQGGITVVLRNGFPLSGTATLQLPKATKASAVFSVSSPVAPNSSATVSSSLVDYLFETESDEKSVAYKFLISTNASANFVTIESDSILSGTFRTQGFVASFIEGQLKPTVFELSSEDILLDFFDGLDSSSRGRFFAPRAETTIRNSIGFGVSSTPTYITVNDKRVPTASQVLLRNGISVPIDVAAQGIQQFQLDTLNSNIAAAVEILPNKIRIIGTARLNPQRAFGMVYDTSGAVLDFKFILPLQLSAIELVGEDTSSLAAIDLGTTQGLAVTFTVQNAIPANAALRTVFLGIDQKPLYIDSAKTIPFTLPRGNATTLIAAAPLAATGFSSGETTTVVNYDLTATEIERLKQAKFVISRVGVDTKQAGTPRKINVRESDKLKLKAVAKITYRINA